MCRTYKPYLFHPSTLINTLLFLILFQNSIQTNRKPIPTQIPLPMYTTNIMPLTYSTTDKNKSISITFPDITFQISTLLYAHTGSINDQLIYNIDQYTDDPINCTLYPTSIIAQLIAKNTYNQLIQNIKYTVSLNNNTNRFYMLASDSKVYVHNFTKNNISLYQSYAIDIAITGINTDGVLSQGNLQLFTISSYLFLINNNNMYYLNQSNTPPFIKVEGYVGKGNLVDVGIIRQNIQLSNSEIWVATTNQVITYTIMNTDKIYVSKVQQYWGNIPDTIAAITYCSYMQQFYVIAARTLYVIKKGQNISLLQYQVNGLCTRINKINKSLYLSCEYDRISFVTQLRIQKNGDQLILNRYYDEDTISGIREVQSIGYNKIALIGDQQAVIIGQAVNRRLLLDLQDRDQQQNYQFVYSFSMYDFYYLPQYSTQQHSLLLVVSQSSVSLHKIMFQSPQLQCTLTPQDNNSIYSILIVFNTTHCPYITQNQQQYTGTYIYCQSFYPVKIQLNKRQYEQKTANFIFFIIMLILTVLILVIAGCGVQIRNKANNIINNLRNKIDKIRVERQQSQFKVI